MFDFKIAAICVLVVVVLLLLYRLYSIGKSFNINYFQGIWVVDTKFAEDAELVEMIFYVHDNLGYLYILGDQGEIFSGVVSLNLDIHSTDAANKWYETGGTVSATLAMTSPHEEETLRTIYPEKLQIILVPLEGTMIWKNGDETLAIYRKDTITN